MRDDLLQHRARQGHTFPHSASPARTARLGMLSIALVLLLGGCAGADHPVSQRITPDVISARVPATLPSDTAPALPAHVPAVIRVPEDYSTIQAAVDHAVPGQLISIGPGVYHEAVRVRTPHLTIAGRDRNRVILDGQKTLPDGISIGPGGDDVVVENLTVRYYVGNGVYWDGVTGYRGSYLTAYDNGDYDIYAYGSRRGQFDHSYASGSPDSGFYIGQCFPCDALVTQVHAENNAEGYSGTNAGGNLVIRDSVWNDNGLGILPNTQDSEELAPQHQVTIVDNLVYDNNNTNAPFDRLEYSLYGIGIGNTGGSDDLIMDNRVEGQQNYGIAEMPDVGANLWTDSGNTVIDNVVSGSGVADLALIGPSGPDNCFSGNHVAKTIPAFLQQTNACDTIGARVPGGDFGASIALLGRFLHANGTAFDARAIFERWRTVPAPPAQPTMPGSGLAPSGPIFTMPWTSGSYATIMPDDPHAISSEKAVAAVGLNSLIEILLGFYSYLLPIALYAAWVGIGLWDIARRDKMNPGPRYGWMAAIVAIPIFGAIAYYMLGKSSLSRGFRWMLVGGTLGIWIVGTTILIILASVVPA
jgi:Right handed beta helix region/Phospholipase_D-nuclease N-terminal